MQELSSFLRDIKPIKNYNATFELATEILRVAGDHKRYNIKFWLKKISTSKLPESEIWKLVAKAETLDKKYNRGGFIINRLFPKKDML